MFKKCCNITCYAFEVKMNNVPTFAAEPINSRLVSQMSIEDPYPRLVSPNKFGIYLL